MKRTLTVLTAKRRKRALPTKSIFLTGVGLIFVSQVVLNTSRGRHFSRENPHLNPTSHFSGPNSIFCIKKPYGKWEMRCEHSETSFLISKLLSLTSHSSFPVFSLLLYHTIFLPLLVSSMKLYIFIDFVVRFSPEYF